MLIFKCLFFVYNIYFFCKLLSIAWKLYWLCKLLINLQIKYWSDLDSSNTSIFWRNWENKTQSFKLIFCLWLICFIIHAVVWMLISLSDALCKSKISSIVVYSSIVWFINNLTPIFINITYLKFLSFWGSQFDFDE